MIRIGEFARSINPIRKKFWLEKLKLEMQWVDFSEESLQAPQALLKGESADGILLDAQFSQALLSHSTRIPSDVRESGLTDSIIRQNGVNWLRCDLRLALHEMILEKASKLDTHSIVYVTGSDSLARLCVAVSAKMGFRKIVLISENHENAQAIAGAVSQLFFNLDFKLLRETELTLQPNNGSLLLNTLPAETGGIVFEDLTYLNFLHHEGLVVDLPFSTQTNALLDEAEHVGIRRLPGVNVWGLRDFYFLQALSIKLQSRSEYLAQWTSFLQEEKQT